MALYTALTTAAAKLINAISPTPFAPIGLIMVDRDGQTKYSDTRRVEMDKPGKPISIFPGISSDKITITADKIQEAVIFSSTGQLIKRIQLNYGAQTLDIASWQNGVYILKATAATVKFIKQ